MCGRNSVSCYYAISLNSNDSEELFEQMVFKMPTEMQLSFLLPGKGKKPAGYKRKMKNGEIKHVYGCGDIMPMYICDNPECGKVHQGPHSCRGKLCPDCYKGWLVKNTDNCYYADNKKSLDDGVLFTQMVFLVLSKNKFVFIIPGTEKNPTVYKRETKKRGVKHVYEYSDDK